MMIDANSDVIQIDGCSHEHGYIKHRLEHSRFSPVFNGLYNNDGG